MPGSTIARLVAILLALGACAAPSPSVGNPAPPTSLPAVSPATVGSSASSSAHRPTPSTERLDRAAPSPTSVRGESAIVVDIVDGDTLTVTTAQGRRIVRLIGIDAPERGSNGKPPECYFSEATTALTRLAPPGTPVVLERDVSDTDRYDRLLRYVWVERDGGWLLVNEELVRLGAAVAREYPPDTRYSQRLLTAQAEAQRARRGLWGACQAAPPEPTPVPRANCDPSYPDLCLPPPPPDLDCRDIPQRRFRVLPPDPHRLDNDRDGIGCEAG